MAGFVDDRQRGTVDTSTGAAFRWIGRTRLRVTAADGRQLLLDGEVGMGSDAVILPPDATWDGGVRLTPGEAGDVETLLRAGYAHNGEQLELRTQW